MQENFKLIEGLTVADTNGIKSAFVKLNSSEINCVISSEKIKPIVKKAVRLIKKPYFFLEIPFTDTEEAELSKKGESGSHMRLYNLEVTHSVADAILERYGDLLINDGVTNFGFCSLETETEIYVMPFQNIMFYNKNDVNIFEKILIENNIPERREEEYITIDSLLSKKNPADRVLVELNGETVFDVIENLKEVGLTLCDTIREG